MCGQQRSAYGRLERSRVLAARGSVVVLHGHVGRAAIVRRHLASGAAPSSAASESASLPSSTDTWSNPSAPAGAPDSSSLEAAELSDDDAASNGMSLLSLESLSSYARSQPIPPCTEQTGCTLRRGAAAGALQGAQAGAPVKSIEHPAEQPEPAGHSSHRPFAACALIEPLCLHFVQRTTHFDS